MRKSFSLILALPVVVWMGVSLLGCSSGSDSSSPTCSPTAETCNGKDDDCDGLVDESSTGSQLTDDCNANGMAGTKTCAGGVWGECKAGCTPQAETCNGKDDDCDGQVDEGDNGALKRDCSNRCGAGTEVCAAGEWTSCTAPQAKDEECNGLDDDCNGKIDDGFECAKGAEEQCGTDVGVCEYGTHTCDATCHWGQCRGGTQPTTETCDGHNDEDCNGTVDNGCTCANGETHDCCGGTQITCSGGTWPSCPTTPTETCNGQDDDCNGKVDDNLPADPYLSDEDPTGQDSCAKARLLNYSSTNPSSPAGVVNEGAEPVSQIGYLYKAAGTADHDFFRFETREDTLLDYNCILHPSWNECYTMVVRLGNVPAGSNYQFCLYGVGPVGSETTCDASSVFKECTTGTERELAVVWPGSCLATDDMTFYVEVYPESGSTLSCEPYTLSVEMLDNSPQEAACDSGSKMSRK